jgi:hypothetical protein
VVHRLDYEREAICPAVAPSGNQPDAHGVPAGHQPETAVLISWVQFVPDGGTMKRRTGIGGYIAAIAVGIEPAEDERKE